MISVCRCVSYIHTERHRQPSITLRKFSAGDDREQHRRSALRIRRISGKIKPRYHGNTIKVLRLSGLCFYRLYMPVCFHVTAHIFIKRRKVFRIGGPHIGKGVVILMKDRIVRMKDIIISRIPVFVPSHSKFLRCRDLPRHAVHKHRIKSQPFFLYLTVQLGDIKRHRHTVAAF